MNKIIIAVLLALFITINCTTEIVYKHQSVTEAQLQEVADEIIKESIEKNIFKCLGKCAKKHLNLWDALALIGKCKKDKKCYLNSLKGKALECANECLAVNEVMEKAVKPLETYDEKNTWRCLGNCAKKHLKVWEALAIIGKCQKDTKCYLNELKGKALECANECLASSKITTEDKPKCEQAVLAARKKFKSLETRKEKKEFAEAIYKKLQAKHPEVCKKKIFGLTTAILSPVPASRVCKLYERIIKPAQVANEVETQSIKCIKSCVKKHLKWSTALKLISKCKLNKSCYLRSVGGKAKDCVLGCVGKKVEPVAVQKVETKSIKCIKSCVKKHLKWTTALKLISKCKLDKNCYLRSVGGKAKDCVLGCVGKKVEPVVVKEVETKSIKCIKSCVKKHLKWTTALKLISKCKLSKSCYLKSVGGKAKDCVLGCVGKTSDIVAEEKPKCEKAVEAIRKKFASLETRKEKYELVKKVLKKLEEKHPEVSRKKFYGLTMALFSRTPAKRVCKMYEFITKPKSLAQDSDDAIAMEIVDLSTKNLGKCLKKCVKKHLKWRTALKLIAKCRINKGCYLKNLGGKALNCVKSCI